MKHFLGAAVSSALLFAASGACLAQESELIAIENIGTNDSYFLFLSYRYTFVDPTAEDAGGFKVRVDAGRSEYDFTAIVPTTGTDWRARILGGYEAQVDESTTVTAYAGAEYHNKANDPDLPAMDDFEEWGFFGSLELSSDTPGGGNLFANVDYSSNAQTVYTSFHYLHPLAEGLLVGPTANYLHEDEYSRWTGGLRLEKEFSDSMSFWVTGAYGEQEVESGDRSDVGYVELMQRFKF